MYIPQFVRSSVDGHLICFQFGAITNKAAINVPVQVFVWTYAFFSLGEIPRSWMARSNSSYVRCMFNFWRSCQTFPKWLYHFHSHKQCIRFPGSPHYCQHRMFSLFILINSNRCVVVLVVVCCCCCCFLIYLFLAVLGLHFCKWAFSGCAEWGLLFIVVRGLLIAVASLVEEHGL